MNYVYVLLLCAAVGGIDCLVGGTRLVFSLPGYLVIGSAGLLSLVSIRRKRFSGSAPCMFSAIALGSYLLARCWCSPVEYLARTDLFAVLGCLGVYLVVALYVTPATARMVFVAGLFVLAGVELFVGLTQFSKGNNFMLFGLIRPPAGTRASGMFINPNHFAGFLEVAGILAVSLVVWSRWNLWAKILTGYIGLACYFGVAISGSRGGYLSVAFSVVVFSILSLVVVRLRAPRRLILWGVIICAVFGGLLIGGKT